MDILRKIFFGILVLALSQFAIAQQQNQPQLPAHLQASPKYQVPAVLSTETVATISSQIPGYIEKLYIKEGSYFKAGDKLLQFDCTVHQAEHQKAQSLTQETRERYKANRRLEQLNAIGKVDVVESKAKYEEAKAEAAIKKHIVQQCTILAPFNGQVVDLMVNAHETVKENQPLFKILDNRNLVVDLIVPSTWLHWINKDTNFELVIKETGKKYKGHIIRIITQVDAVSRSVKLLGVVTGEHAELRSGMSGEAIFKGPSP